MRLPILFWCGFLTLAVCCTICSTPGKAQVQITLIQGIDFGPYVDGQSPKTSPPPRIPISQIQARMSIVAPFTQWIRSYGSTNGLENIPAVARGFGLKVAAEAWVDPNSDPQEITNLIAAANAGNVDIAIVGSEVLYRNQKLPASQFQTLLNNLVSDLQQVRAAVPQNVKVTTAEIPEYLLNFPQLIANSDVVMTDIYPYNEGVPIQNAACFVGSRYQQVVGAAGTKQVIIAETGWPSCGQGGWSGCPGVIGTAIPSPAGASQALLDFISWAQANSVSYFYYEALDEEWLGLPFGIWDPNGHMKPGAQDVFYGATAPVNCSVPPGGTGTPGISFTYVSPLDLSGTYVPQPPLNPLDADTVKGVVQHVDTSAYEVATYEYVKPCWYIKPYYTTPQEPQTVIQLDGNWSTPEVEDKATIIASFVVPNNCSPQGNVCDPNPLSPVCSGQVASVQVNRSPGAIVGIIADSSGNKIQGVTVTLTGTDSGTTQSAEDGMFSFPNLPSGVNDTITPSLANYTFSPSSQTFSNVTGIVAAQQFTATGPALLAIIPTRPLFFGSQALGTTSALNPVSLQNSGATPISLTGFSTAAPFSIAASNCQSALPALGICEIDIAFSPSSAGAKTGTLSITDSASGNPHALELEGTGVAAPIVTFSTEGLTFGIQTIGSSSIPQTMTISNIGTAPLMLNSIVFTGDFSQTNTTCGSSVAAGADCTVSINFAPTAPGPRKGQISINDNAGFSPQAIVLTGVGAAAMLSPTSLTFSGQKTETTSGAQPVTLTNKSNAALNIWQIAITGANASDFSITSNTTCSSALAAGASCTISVTFTPSGTGSRNASLLVSNDGGGSPEAVALTGTGGAGPAEPSGSLSTSAVSFGVQQIGALSGSLSTTAVSFGEQEIGTMTAAQTVILANKGRAELKIRSVTVSGPSSQDFTETNNCGSMLPAGRSCVLRIRFAPHKRGERTAVIRIVDGGEARSLEVQVRGIGAEPRDKSPQSRRASED